VFSDVLEEVSSANEFHDHEDVCRSAYYLIPEYEQKVLQRDHIYRYSHIYIALRVSSVEQTQLFTGVESDSSLESSPTLH